MVRNADKDIVADGTVDRLKNLIDGCFNGFVRPLQQRAMDDIAALEAETGRCWYGR